MALTVILPPGDHRNALMDRLAAVLPPEAEVTDRLENPGEKVLLAAALDDDGMSEGVFTLLRQRWRDGKELGPAALAGSLEPEEMSHLAALLQKPESLSNGEKAMHDYITTIQMERVKREGADGLDPLMAYREKKRMEDRTHE